MYSYLSGVKSSSSSDPFQFGKYPYKRFKINGMNYGPFRLAKQEKMSSRQLEFWSKCGPNMTHLEISSSTFQSVDEFEAILFRFLPKLVYLELIDVQVSERRLNEVDRTTLLMKAPSESTINSLEELTLGQYDERVLPVSWIRFLAQFPRIKSLRVTNSFSGLLYIPRRELADILKAMTILAREQGISWKFEKLNLLLMHHPLGVVLNIRHSEPFRQLQLPLTTLCLHIGVGSSSLAFRSILETCAYTLRKLVVYSEGLTIQDVGDEITQNFPYGVQLDTLSKLCLSGRLLCDNLNFLPFTPNLTSLILAQDIGNSLLAAGSNVSDDQILDDISQMLSQDEIDRDGHLREAALSIVEGTDFSRLEHLVCPNLKELIMSGRQESTCSAYQVAALSRLIPNLKTLMLGLDNDGFRAACAGWKQLEVLIIQPYDVDQFGLTGNVPLLKHRLPNLSDLTKLRYFGMGFETKGRRKTNLSDESVLNAILPLENLQEITAVYDSNKIIREVLDHLLSKFPGSKIKESGDDNHEWSREKAVDESSHDSDSDEDTSSDVYQTEEENSQEDKSQARVIL